jgi:hypothetical protein
VTGAAWQAVMRIKAGVRDLVQRTRDGQAQVEYSVAGRSRGQVTLCVVYTVPKETRSVDFLVQPQNQGQWFLSVWPQNRWLRFLWFGWPQNHSLKFFALGLKTGSCGLVIWPIKSPQWFLGLSLKTKWDMVCWLCHKTNVRMKMTWNTCRDLAACFT